jgi:hypothetical protein
MILLVRWLSGATIRMSKYLKKRSQLKSGENKKKKPQISFKRLTGTVFARLYEVK